MQKAWCFHPRKFVRSNGVSTGATSQYLQPIVPDLKNVAFKIKDVIPSERIDSVRLRHIQVETKELAEDCKRLLSEGLTDFASLASSLSTCSHSKGRGGDLGWHFLHVEKEATSDTHSIPLELKNAAIFMSKGDITVVSSDFEAPLESVPSKLVSVSKRWHVLQLLDATTVLTPTLMKRRRDSFAQSKVKASPSTPNLPEAISPTYSIETMGCQMNMADSERMEAQLVDLGYSRTHNNSVANVVIINTCSIRDHAEQKVYSYLGPHVARKRRGEDVSIMVAGCVAQQEGQKILRRFPEIDAVMGPQYANKVGDILQSVFEGHQLVATDPAIQSEDRVPALRKSDIAAYVNVIYGCNERCTYCVVPNTRGIEQSRTKDAIIAEIGDLVAHGYQEITLLGQNIDSWGRDMTPKQRFADLLIAVAQVPGLRRVRFLTSHPKYMSRRVVEAVAANKVLTPCFNVPFQSGNDEILRLMRRGYTRSRYLEIVQSIRSLVPDAAITADCIVGFPGETEEQFQDTLSLMEEVTISIRVTLSSILFSS